ncbi:MAG: asparaginase domain-containing protein [Pacificimonas sp.]
MSDVDLHVLTTGGTIDKVYFDALSEFEVGEPAMRFVLREANITLDYEITSLMKKDSLELTDDDRAAIRDAALASEARCILVTHGTDTMVQSALVVEAALGEVTDRTVVFTGAMLPASQRSTDAIFNVGFAIAAARISPPGVYVAMNGRLFRPGDVRKDRAANRFVGGENA